MHILERAQFADVFTLTSQVMSMVLLRYVAVVKAHDEGVDKRSIFNSFSTLTSIKQR